MHNCIKVFYISVLFIISFELSSQVMASNPSFEATHGDATMPPGWFLASPGTTPDILPGFWGVYIEPFDGESYVGLITREDGSFESIGQRLSRPLSKDVCYKMSVALAHANTYVGYNKPLRLRIWIADKKSDRQQLVFESPRIESENWDTYEFEFTPNKEMRYIILEAFISEDRISYKGNILVDHLGIINYCFRA